MSGIAPGVHFCGVDGYHYIVRSENGRYMKSDNLNKGSNIHEYDLHQSCRGGDHYLANDGHFYVIKGPNYRRVTNMNTDADAVVYSLHPNCQGGDHYLSMSGKFYIIYKDRGIYRRTTNMNKDEQAVEYSLHSSCKDGLCYWGEGDHAYFVQPLGVWGAKYHKTTNLNKDSHGVDYSFANDVLKFISA